MKNTFKYLPRFLLILFVLAAVAGARARSNAWVGVYEFDEDGGKTAGGTAIFVSHRLEIKESDGGGLLALMQSNGYQTSKDLVCTARAEGDKLLIYFDSYGEDNMFESYKQGALLLTLQRRAVKNRPEILTFWGEFQPIVPKNEKPGKVYFKKTS